MTVSNLIDIRNQLPTAHPENRPGDRQIGTITDIIVHYDAVARPANYDPITRYVGEAQYHIAKDWSIRPGVSAPIFGFALMYHIKIDALGHKYLCNSFERVLWHARIANQHGLAVCVDLGDGQDPLPAQLTALHEVLMDLCFQSPEFPAGRPNVWGHREVRTNSTNCPGRLWTYVRRFRAGTW